MAKYRKGERIRVHVSGWQTDYAGRLVSMTKKGDSLSIELEKDNELPILIMSPRNLLTIEKVGEKNGTENN